MGFFSRWTSGLPLTLGSNARKRRNRRQDANRRKRKNRLHQLESLEPRMLLSVDLSLLQHRVVGTQDTGYTETGSNWQTYTDSSSYQGTFCYHASGSDGANAQFSFGSLDPTQSYQVFVTWSAASNRASNSPFTVLDGSTPLATVSINQQCTPLNATGNGTVWESLGTYRTNTGTLNVDLGDAANGYVIANAACVAAVPPVTTAPSVIDNGDAAYAESGSGWSGYAEAAAYGGDFRYHSPGSGADTATWTFQALQPGRDYQVYATWSAASNRADNAPYTVLDGTTPLGTKLLDQKNAPSDATIDGQGWESLGVYTITTGTLAVQLSDAGADGYVAADAVRLVDVTPPPPPPAPAVVGNGDSAYGESGSGWQGYSDTAAYGGQFRYHTPGDGSDAATWTFAGVDPSAQYQVYATWTAASNRADNSPFTVLDGTTPLATTMLDQKFAPSDTTIDGQGWESLGVYTASSGTLGVKLTDSADGDVIANAVRIVEVPPVTAPPSVVADGSAAYGESGSGWTGYSEAAAYQGHFRYHSSGDGSDAATWTFQAVDPGAKYEVLATWSAASNRADNAPFTVLDGTTPLATTLVDQKNAPTDVTIDGQGWESLGVYTATTGTLAVKLTDNADGDVIANAVEIVELPSIDSLADSLSSVVIGQPLVLTATNVQDSQSGLQGVAFYRQLPDGTKQQLPGTVVQSRNDWSITVDTTGLAPGPETFFAQATAINGGASDFATAGVNLAAPQLLDWDPAGANLGGYNTWDTTTPVWWSPSDNQMETWQNGDIACFQGSPGTVTIPAGSQISAASIEFNSNYAIQGPGELCLPSGGTTIDVEAASATIGAVNAGSGPLTKQGSGTVTLSGANTYTGGSQIVAGAVALAGVTPLGTGTVDLAGGTLQFVGTSGFSGAYYNVANNGYVPEFSGLTPVATRVDATIDFPNDGNGFEPGISGLDATDSGAVWTGVLNITTGGVYTFQTTSDDGSLLYVDGTQVVNDDGPHGMQTASGTIDLTAGNHLVTVQYVQAGGGAGIIAQYSGADTGDAMIDLGSRSGSVSTGGPLDLPNALNVTADSSVQLPDSGGPASLASLVMGGQTLHVIGSGTLAVSGAVTLAGPGSATFDVPESATLNLNGVVSGDAGLTKAGAGSLVLAAANTYSGTTNVIGGTLRLGSEVSGFGGDGGGWTTNAGATISGDVLTLTDNGGYEARSAFYDTPLPVNAPFQATFTYQASGSSDPADGAAFVLENDPAGAGGVGGTGSDLGYGGITPSAAVEFNVYSGHTRGTGYYNDGQTGGNGGSDYIATGPVNLASGDPIQVDLTYDGINLVETLTDQTTGATFITTYDNVNLADQLGGNTAYVGFTGGTGGSASTQTIDFLNFTFVTGGGSILPATTSVEIAGGATLDLGGSSQTIASLADAVPGATTGEQVLLGGGTLNGWQRCLDHVLRRHFRQRQLDEDRQWNPDLG